jgi:hypothetical protein
VVFSNLDREETLMDGIAQSVNDTGTVNIQAGGMFILKRIKAGARSNGISGNGAGMSAKRFEERVPRGNPFQVVLLGYDAIR